MSDNFVTITVVVEARLFLFLSVASVPVAVFRRVRRAGLKIKRMSYQVITYNIAIGCIFSLIKNISRINNYTYPCVVWLIPMLLVKRLFDLSWDFYSKTKIFCHKFVIIQTPSNLLHLPHKNKTWRFLITLVVTQSQCIFKIKNPGTSLNHILQPIK